MAQPSARPSGRPKVKILAVVWGAEHIERLDRFGISSFLAPGNLPALAAACDVELVLLTSADDEATFEALPSMAALRRHVDIRYIAIDDLIAPGQYSTTLHLAFTRGVAAFGEAMTDMHFLFWNADFVLSDGAFRHLAGLIEQGHKVVITGTLRANAEQAEAILTQRRSAATGILTASSRSLVDLAFRFQHPHHVAKIVNQSVCWTTMPSQMLWRVDAQMQLGRFFKAFMFCLKPTRVISSINGPCDYAFVPELCPGEPQHMIDDSDDAFILELQPQASEREFIRVGPRNEDERRACMMEWLTPEHLDTGRRMVALKSGGDTPATAIAKARKEFDAYFDGFMKGVAAPMSHAGQYYWLFGVASWKQNRDRFEPLAVLPPELNFALSLSDLKHPSNNRHRQAPASAGGGLRGGLRTIGFGAPHHPRRLHPDAAATPILAKAVAATRSNAGAQGRILVIAPLHGWADAVLPLDDPNLFRFEPAPAAFWPLQGAPNADAVFVYNRPGAEFDVGGLLNRISGALADGAHVTLLWHDPALKGPHDWVEAQVKQALSAFGQLDAPKLETFAMPRRDRRYASAFYAAMPHLADPNAGSRGWRGKIALALAMLGRASGLGSRAPSDRPVVASITGRYRRPAAVPHVEAAIVELHAQGKPAARRETGR